MREAYVPTQQPETQEDPWIPAPNALNEEQAPAYRFSAKQALAQYAATMTRLLGRVISRDLRLRRSEPHHIGLDAGVIGDLVAGSHIDHERFRGPSAASLILPTMKSAGCPDNRRWRARAMQATHIGRMQRPALSGAAFGGMLRGFSHGRQTDN